MDGNTLRSVVLVCLGSGLGLWLLSTLWFRVSGTWEREHDTTEARGHVERLTLAQVGPFVAGRRDVRGGHQEYSGVMWGRTLWLTRRDHGVGALADAGFPRTIAEKLDGAVMARLRLQLREGVLLDGTFTPQKVDFTHQPPRVTQLTWQAPQARRYHKLIAVEDEAQAEVPLDG